MSAVVSSMMMRSLSSWSKSTPHWRMLFPQCFEPFALRRQFVAGRHQKFQWDSNLGVPIAEPFLIDNSQEGVLYGRSRLPYLIEKHHVGCWQIAFNAALIFVLVFQFANTHRPEDFVRRAETRHQVLE